MEGEIIKWFGSRGFGFIKGENGQEVFCHISNIEDGQNQELSVGTKVVYDIEESKEGKGPQAVNVLVT